MPFSLGRSPLSRCPCQTSSTSSFFELYVLIILYMIALRVGLFLFSLYFVQVFGYEVQGTQTCSISCSSNGWLSCTTTTTCNADYNQTYIQTAGDNKYIQMSYVKKNSSVKTNQISDSVASMRCFIKCSISAEATILDYTLTVTKKGSGTDTGTTVIAMEISSRTSVAIAVVRLQQTS
jgi:hypothetical protein